MSDIILTIVYIISIGCFIFCRYINHRRTTHTVPRGNGNGAGGSRDSQNELSELDLQSEDEDVYTNDKCNL